MSCLKPPVETLSLKKVYSFKSFALLGIVKFATLIFGFVKEKKENVTSRNHQYQVHVLSITVGRGLFCGMQNCCRMFCKTIKFCKYIRKM